MHTLIPLRCTTRLSRLFRLRLVPTNDIWALGLVDKSFNNMISRDSFWRSVYEHRWRKAKRVGNSWKDMVLESDTWNLNFLNDVLADDEFDRIAVNVAAAGHTNIARLMVDYCGEDILYSMLKSSASGNHIDIIRLKLGIRDDINLKFWSSDTGILMMEKEGYTHPYLPNEGIEKLTPDTRYADISRLGGLTLVVTQSEDKSFLNELEFASVKEFLKLVDFTTQGNIEFSIRNREDALSIKAFLKNVFKPLATIFSNEFDLGISDNQPVIEYGIENLVVNNFLSKDKLAKIDPAYHQLYQDFVSSLFKFKFKDILENTIATRPTLLQYRIKQAIFLTMFDYLAQQEHLDLKSITVPEFINEINTFTDTYSDKTNFKSLINDITHESMNTNFFMKLSEFFMTTDPDPKTKKEIMGAIAGVTTFHGWIFESTYMFTTYVDRVINVLKDSGFDITGMYQWSERNPQHSNRIKTREFNIKLLQGQSKEIDKLINNNIDKTRYLPNLPTNAREFDILVLLILDVIPTFYSTHLKSVRSDLVDSTTVIRDKKYGLSRDSLGHILEASKYWLTTIYYASGDIQGPRQISDLVSATLKSSQNSKEILKFMFNDLQSSDKLFEKGQLDSQIFHAATNILNEYISDLTFSTPDKVSDELSLLFNSFNSDPAIMDQDYASIIEQRIKDEVLKIYRRTNDDDKIAYITDNWNSIYRGIKDLFTQETDSLLRDLSGGRYELVWEDKIVHSFLRFDGNGDIVKLTGDLLLSDTNFIGIIDLSAPNKLRNPTSTETFDVPMIVIRDKNNHEKWGLIRSDELPLLPSNYKFTDIILNTREGYILDGQNRLGATLNDLGKDWYLSQSYLENSDYFFEEDGIFTLKNSYRYIMYFTGENLVPFLQESIYNFVPAPAHEQYFIKEIKKSSALKTSYRTFVAPPFKKFSNLDAPIQRELIEILSALDQIGNVFLLGKSESFKFDTTSSLIISEEFFEQDISIIRTILNEMNPTEDQLSDLSYSRQKLFYHTLHELLKGYTGSNTIINNYKSKHSGTTFQNIHSKEFTTAESTAVEMMEVILPKVFGYRFYSALKLGIISLIKDGTNVDLIPINLHISLIREITNGRRINGVNERYLNLQTAKEFSHRGLEILTTCLVFGHATTLDVVGESNPLVIYTRPDTSFLSDLTEGEFIHPSSPQGYYRHYGQLIQSFLREYSRVEVPNYFIRKNIDGKTAMMKGFASLLQFQMSSKTIKSAGKELSIEEFENNPDIWSRKNVNYAFAQVFEKLLNPSRTPTFRDVTYSFRQVFIGKVAASTHKITSGNIRTTSFWQNDNYGRLALDYATLSQFFGRDFHIIQPALFYTYYNLENHLQPLNIDQLLTNEFIDKVDHLYKNFKEILSTKYSNGQTLTAFFHKEDASGLHRGTLLREIFRTQLDKFNELEGGTMIEITLRKDLTGEIINKDEFNDFISTIVFYLVKFNSLAFIKEGTKTSRGVNYGLFASQREIFSNEYITGVSGSPFASSVVLSDIGEQILLEYQSNWNVEDSRTVWNYEACWPIYLLSDHNKLRKWFIDHFKSTIRDLI